MNLTIIIKALNEEEKIPMCIESALKALEAFKGEGEIILADSLSTDGTVAIAMQYPIRIVQLVNPEDRSCGAGWQLGYQFARGEYIWLTDGDMTLIHDFASQAIEYLKENPDVAGVAGLLIDTHAHTSAEKRRIGYYSKINNIIDVSSLGGGGVYKKEAIEAVGYISNRWLSAAEEAELGCRLRREGWRLVRLPIAMARHTGRRESELEKLLRLLRTKRMSAYGALLRHALGKRWFADAIKAAWFVFIAPVLAVIALGLWAAISTLDGLSNLTAFFLSAITVYVSAFMILALKKRSVREAAISMLSYHLNALAAIQGFVAPSQDPTLPVNARVLKD